MKSKIQEAIDKAGKWIDYEGVEGIAQGERDGKDCILVFVSSVSSNLSSLIPPSFMGFTVLIDEMEAIDIHSIK